MNFIERITLEYSAYTPALTRQPDFDDFWNETRAAAQAVPLNARRTRIDYPSPYVHVYDIHYNGMDDTDIHGWLIVPAFITNTKFPCLINYHGFSGSRGSPSEFMPYVMMGFAVLTVDCRHQGGNTGNHARYSSGFATNVASKGVHDKYEYYYRYAYMDCLKAIDFACSQPEVDTDRIVLHGISQGGGLAMAVSALDSRPVLAIVDVPSNSNLERRIEGNHGAFASVADYLKQHPQDTDRVLRNLSYFDTMNMADKISCKVFASVAYRDETCPAEMYYATYNRIESSKEIKCYPFNGHEGGGNAHTEEKLSYLRKHFADWFE